jgi:hypothetical protein
MGSIDQLKRAVEIIRSGKKPMRAKIFAPFSGPNRNQYEVRGCFFDTPDELSRYLDDYETIENRPNVIFYFPEDTPDYEGD